MSVAESVPESLLKYETPILVSSSYKKSQASKQKLAPLILSNQRQGEDFLNSILPPQEIYERNQLWVRYVSSTPATTFDVTNLKHDLEKQITHQGARDSGICPIREEIYS